ncbi:hypothetical protein F5Y03DRAFT_378963 [Xylaria venustula]|nr:hypothetical protein F5Y03DRAFT_378963 [Xylaria venustula]
MSVNVAHYLQVNFIIGMISLAWCGSACEGSHPRRPAIYLGRVASRCIECVIDNWRASTVTAVYKALGRRW